MYKKKVFLLCYVLLLSLGGSALADIMAYYPMDEGSGTDVADASGNGHDGVIEGTAEWTQGAPGFGSGIDFPGIGGSNWVNTGSWDPSDGTGILTIATWFKVDATTGTYQGLLCQSRDTDEAGNMQFQLTLSANLEIGFAASYAFWLAYSDPVPLGEWHHAAFCLNIDTVEIFYDGVSIGTNSTNIALNPDLSDGMVLLATAQVGRQYTAGFALNGVLDEVYIFNNAMTAEEITQVMEGKLVVIPGQAKRPSPADEAEDIPRDIVLSWQGDEDAVAHDVYFGDNFEDVNSATRTDQKNVLVSQGQPGASYDPEGLPFGEMRYWRIDEVQAGNVIIPGNVWSFTVEPVAYPIENIEATASVTSDEKHGPDKLIDGSGMTDGMAGVKDDTMWFATPGEGEAVSLQFDFDRAYKLHQVHIWNYNLEWEYMVGFGLKEISIETTTDGETWTSVGDFELDQAPGAPNYAGQILDLGGAAAKSVRINAISNYGIGGQGGANSYGLSEIEFSYIPTFAREPEPASGATEFGPAVTLNWRSGREAVSHQIYLDTDPNAVADELSVYATANTNTYDLGVLDLGYTYYWKIVEINDAEIPSAWASDTWDFSTPEYIVVDDFESYTDEPGEEVFVVWPDGYGDASNGSQVTYDNPPYMELTTVHSGDQSMPYHYGKDGAANSEATMNVGGENWTFGNAKTLVLWFHGDLSNSPAQLYVKIGTTRINYPGDPAGLAAPMWKQWNIDLTGMSVSRVNSMTIGVDGPGEGILFIDDIRLYREAPAMPGPAVDPGTANLKAYYPMSGSVADTSGNNRNGTVGGAGTGFGDGPTGYGQAMTVDGTSTAYATIPVGPVVQASDSMTVAAWVSRASTGTNQRVFDFGNNTTVYMFMAPDSGGGVRFAITTTSNSGESQVVSDDPLPADGSWHHVAIVIDADAAELNLYVDGTLADTAATATLPSDLGSTANNWISRSQWTADPYMTGSIDEFRIYDRALSDAEVRYLVGDK